MNSHVYSDDAEAEFEGGEGAPVAKQSTRLKKTKKPKFNSTTHNLPPVPRETPDDHISSESEGGHQPPRLWYFSKDENVETIKFFDTEIDYNLKKQILFKKHFDDSKHDLHSFASSS